ncbi:MAG: phage holin family protein [Salinibacter sp.]
MAMESHDDRPSVSESDRSLTDVPDGGKAQRIAAHTQGLFEDLREWIDLRIDLAILEVEERLDETKNDIALGLILAIVSFFAALFALTTIALGVGMLLGHSFWGFLAVTVALFLIVVGLRVTQPALVPPSNLFESLRGGRKEGSDDSSARPASAAMEDASSRDDLRRAQDPSDTETSSHP